MFAYSIAQTTNPVMQVEVLLSIALSRDLTSGSRLQKRYQVEADEMRYALLLVPRRLAPKLAAERTGHFEFRRLAAVARRASALTGGIAEQIARAGDDGFRQSVHARSS
jgi:hypothetical protein